MKANHYSPAWPYLGILLCLLLISLGTWKALGPADLVQEQAPMSKPDSRTAGITVVPGDAASSPRAKARLDSDRFAWGAAGSRLQRDLLPAAVSEERLQHGEEIVALAPAATPAAVAQDTSGRELARSEADPQAVADQDPLAGPLLMIDDAVRADIRLPDREEPAASDEATGELGLAHPDAVGVLADEPEGEETSRRDTSSSDVPVGAAPGSVNDHLEEGPSGGGALPSTVRVSSPEQRLAMRPLEPRVSLRPDSSDALQDGKDAEDNSGSGTVEFASKNPAAQQSAQQDSPALESLEPISLALIERLGRLQKHPAAEAWASEAIALLEQTEASDLIGGSDQQAPLAALERLLSQGDALAQAESAWLVRREILRAKFALQRRYRVWQHAAALPRAASYSRPTAGQDSLALRQTLAEAAAATEEVPQAEFWRSYLLLDALQDAMTSTVSEAQREELADRVLARLEKARRPNASQRLPAGPWRELEETLGTWQSAQPDLLRTLQLVEEYEATRSPRLAQRLARHADRLMRSDNQQVRAFGESLDRNYRNANVRISLSAEFLQRFLPPRQAFDAPVRDHILGAAVRGRSYTTTDLSLVPVPDGGRWRVNLLAHGSILTQTRACSGPATFHNNGHAEFQATKPVLLDARGVHVAPATVAVRADSSLVDVETSYDGVPLLGSIVRSVAVSQHEDSREQALAITRRRVSRQVRERVDEQVDLMLGRNQSRAKAKLGSRLETLDLAPAIVEMRTTESNLISRLRLSGEDHLGAHTPRPVAPSGGALSLQVHESAVNNVISQLELSGRSFTVPDLFAHVQEQLQLDKKLPPDLPRDAEITFAEEDPVVVRCDDGKIEITLAIAELKDNDRQYRNFTVRTHYTPGVAGMQASLARRDIIQLQGQRIRFASQIVLRGIFAKVFAPETPHKLVPQRLIDDARLDGLAVTQLEIVDGWIGLTLGPAKVAMRNRYHTGKQEVR